MAKEDPLYENDEPEQPTKGRSILINFVLDKSGSMGSIQNATISGFNEFKNDQACEAGEAFFTLTLFDTAFSTPIAGVPVRRVRDLSYDNYRPSGMTALYDAIGHTMKLTDDFVARNHPDQVLFVIMTDGLENSSRQYTQRQIFDLIADRQANADYEFIFLGSNQDSYAVSENIGIRHGRSLDYASTSESTRASIDRVNTNVKAYRRHGEAQVAQMFEMDFERMGIDDGVPLAEKQAHYLEQQRRKGLDPKRGQGREGAGGGDNGGNGGNGGGY